MAVINKDNENMDFSVQIARKYGAPIDKDSVFYSLSAAETYASNSPLAYVGQVISVVDEVHSNAVTVYQIESDGTLKQVGKEPDLSNYVTLDTSQEITGQKRFVGESDAYSTTIDGDGISFGVYGDTVQLKPLGDYQYTGTSTVTIPHKSGEMALMSDVKTEVQEAASLINQSIDQLRAEVYQVTELSFVYDSAVASDYEGYSLTVPSALRANTLNFSFPSTLDIRPSSGKISNGQTLTLKGYWSYESNGGWYDGYSMNYNSSTGRMEFRVTSGMLTGQLPSSSFNISILSEKENPLGVYEYHISNLNIKQEPSSDASSVAAVNITCFTNAKVSGDSVSLIPFLSSSKCAVSGAKEASIKVTDYDSSTGYIEVEFMKKVLSGTTLTITTTNGYILGDVTFTETKIL